MTLLDGIDKDETENYAVYYVEYISEELKMLFARDFQQFVMEQILRARNILNIHIRLLPRNL